MDGWTVSLHRALLVFGSMLWLGARAVAAGSAPLPEPGALRVVDLASDTAWTLSCDGSAPRPIRVPGGGWNSDLQSPVIQVMREVKDHVVYERKITVPAAAENQAVALAFGAVNYGCEVYLDGKKAGEHHGPQVPFEIDVTALATPGREQTLRVIAFHRRHYLRAGERRTAEVAVGWDYPGGDDPASRAEAKVWCGWAGNSKVGYGIVRSVRLLVRPSVHVSAVLVRPSVSRRELGCEVWVRNGTAEARTVRVRGVLSAWNGPACEYPAMAPLEIAVPAGGEAKGEFAPVPWGLGPESYWWPNIPFREDYAARLHALKLEVSEGANVWQAYPVRFGFVEHGEGPHYYTVNGVRVTGLSDGTAEGQVSSYDSYSAPAWLPPTGPGSGAPESFRRYMRMGINTNRLHCSPPTEYMMQVADELGFMLIPEAPIWGNGLSRYNPDYTPQTYRDMGLACRNHPSVARYSLTNEVREKRDAEWPWRAAIDDMRQVDPTRPLTFELHKQGNGRVEGFKGGHAWIMEHYTNIHEKVGEGKGIRGMGEEFWHADLGKFAVGIRTLRVNGWCYMAGWSWLNYWPNFLEGMSSARHAWKRDNHPDRVDGIDGWGSPIVEFARKSLHPYLVQDLGVLEMNPGPPVAAASGGGVEWPYQSPVLIAGRPVVRQIEVFNGGLFGGDLAVRWELRWDAPDGAEVAGRGEIGCAIEPGHHATRAIEFTAPELAGEREARDLYLVLESRRGSEVFFRDDSTRLRVAKGDRAPALAKFLGRDAATGGGWRAKYGREGCELASRESEMPVATRFRWSGGETFVYHKQSEDRRALEFFQNDTPATARDRVAAARFGKELAFELDLGDRPRKLSLYCLDWDGKGREQEVSIREAATGSLLDRQTVAGFVDGVYATWSVQGRVQVIVRRVRGDNAVVSGVFLDPETR